MMLVPRFSVLCCFHLSACHCLSVSTRRGVVFRKPTPYRTHASAAAAADAGEFEKENQYLDFELGPTSSVAMSEDAQTFVVGTFTGGISAWALPPNAHDPRASPRDGDAARSKGRAQIDELFAEIESSVAASRRVLSAAADPSGHDGQARLGAAAAPGPRAIREEAEGECAC